MRSYDTLREISLTAVFSVLECPPSETHYQTTHAHSVHEIYSVWMRIVLRPILWVCTLRWPQCVRKDFILAVHRWKMWSMVMDGHIMTRILLLFQQGLTRFWNIFTFCPGIIQPKMWIIEIHFSISWSEVRYWVSEVDCEAKFQFIFPVRMHHLKSMVWSNLKIPQRPH